MTMTNSNNDRQQQRQTATVTMTDSDSNDDQWQNNNDEVEGKTQIRERRPQGDPLSGEPGERCSVNLIEETTNTKHTHQRSKAL